MDGSLRNKTDNILYFGYNNNSGTANIENNSLDYVIPQKYNEKVGRYFQIKYHIDTNEYSIKDLGNSMGTFIKIEDSFPLRNNSMINIGDSYLVFYFGEAIEENDSGSLKISPSNFKNINGKGYKLKVKLFDKNNHRENKEYIFNNIKKKIYIGRINHNNDIEIEDHLSSKINSIIEYNNKIGWIIKDGNEIIKKNGDKKRIFSTNGTWLLAVENTKIYDGLVFKINFNLFRCSFVKI